ncbi:MAG: P-type conjugative transfer protein TrbG, partial [Alphaproteobacteria bacterium]
MTRKTKREFGSAVFRKSGLLVLLLSAAALSACATNRTPQFSYDADVPPLPVVQTTATDERPRPLHAPPAWTVARGGTDASTPAGRVENAN